MLFQGPTPPSAISMLGAETADALRPIAGFLAAASPYAELAMIGYDIYELFSGGAHPQFKGNEQASQQGKNVPNKACNAQPATSFMQTHQADAATLANELHVPTNYVLAVAGDESAYGTSNIAVGANNYFGLHAGAPGSIGPWSGNPIVAAFAPGGGFMASGQSFVQIASPLLKGLPSPISPTSFFTALHAKWGIGTRNYVSKMVQSSQMAQTRMSCP